MKRIHRREFVACALAGAGTVWSSLNPRLLAEATAPPKKKTAADQVMLGETGIMWGSSIPLLFSLTRNWSPAGQ